jgi:hypothetical protein
VSYQNAFFLPEVFPNCNQPYDYSTSTCNQRCKRPHLYPYYIYKNAKCLPACVPTCLRPCLPACVPACLPAAPGSFRFSCVPAKFRFVADNSIDCHVQKGMFIFSISCPLATNGFLPFFFFFAATTTLRLLYFHLQPTVQEAALVKNKGIQRTDHP